MRVAAGAYRMVPEQAQGDSNGSSLDAACDQQILHIGSSSTSDMVTLCRSTKVES